MSKETSLAPNAQKGTRATLLKSVEDWKQIASIYRCSRGIRWIETPLGQGPVLVGSDVLVVPEVELIRIVTNGLGTSAAILVDEDGKGDALVGKWDDVEPHGEEDRTEEAFEEWITLLIQMLDYRS